PRYAAKAGPSYFRHRDNSDSIPRTPAIRQSLQSSCFLHSKLAPSSSGRPGRQVPVALPLANSPPPPSTTAVDIAKRQDENELLRSQVRAAALRKIPPLRFLRPISARTQFPSRDRKSTRLNSSHVAISYAVFCLK